MQHGKDDSTNPDRALVEVELISGEPIVNLPPLQVSSAPVRNKPVQWPQPRSVGTATQDEQLVAKSY